MKNRTIKFLGYYQLIGGLIGLVMFLPQLMSYIVRGYGFLNCLILSAIVSLFFLSYKAGAKCIDKEEGALKLSKINQALQVPRFNLEWISYKYYAGLYFSIGTDMQDGFFISFHFGFLASEIQIDPNGESLIVMVNIIAFLLLLAILKIENTNSKDQTNAFEGIDNVLDNE